VLTMRGDDAAVVVVYAPYAVRARHRDTARRRACAVRLSAEGSAGATKDVLDVIAADRMSMMLRFHGDMVTDRELCRGTLAYDGPSRKSI
jgi:hypothetical protein